MKKTNSAGFTIIELFIIVILIGVVAVFIISELSSVRRDNRNNEREDDISELRSSLEYYYGVNGFYPTSDQLNDPKFRELNLPGFNDEFVKDPLNSSEGKLTLESQGNAYSYAPSLEEDVFTACDNDKIICTSYELTATLEGGEVLSRTNFN
ncbi:MAG: hypothetical protein M3P98_00405 [bacterium]|nr:hypothetical protein [bacterium]